jgi:hypothetical protein
MERTYQSAAALVSRAAGPLARLDVMSVSRAPVAGATRGGLPGIWLTIAEPVNQVVRPAYAKLDEDCSE